MLALWLRKMSPLTPVSASVTHLVQLLVCQVWLHLRLGTLSWQAAGQAAGQELAVRRYPAAWLCQSLHNLPSGAGWVEGMNHTPLQAGPRHWLAAWWHNLLSAAQVSSWRLLSRGWAPFPPQQPIRCALPPDLQMLLGPAGGGGVAGCQL